MTILISTHHSSVIHDSNIIPVHLATGILLAKTGDYILTPGFILVDASVLYL